ncbi:hypothetical protein E2C01_062649 [Portunus trituberculatus]|uniref:Secreted protein n=1 Tax=Portunus trituberculatus TaxID=210409 RepID=A0A5B7HHW6_PORTR|nr:hypothetical protein [Portunus trituberculatus]
MVGALSTASTTVLAAAAAAGPPIPQAAVTPSPCLPPLAHCLRGRMTLKKWSRISSVETAKVISCLSRHIIITLPPPPPPPQQQQQQRRRRKARRARGISKQQPRVRSKTARKIVQKRRGISEDQFAYHGTSRVLGGMWRSAQHRDTTALD